MTAALLGLLTACGGGGGSGTPPAEDIGDVTPPPPPPPPPVVDILSDSRCALQYQPPGTRPLLTGMDPQRVEQWHLNNDGRYGLAGEDLRASAAWSIATGKGVRVAVIDDAIEVTHEDLWPNVIAGKSYNYYGQTRGNSWPMPCSQDDDHGTAVAGVIAARGLNGVGGSGVAYNAELVGYNAIATKQDADVMDALNRDLAVNHIYNNSWGSPDDGRLHPAEAAFIDAIDEGIRTGRAGKGAIYVFPSGNGGCYNPDLAATPEPEPCVRENSNYDGYVNKLGTLTVCGVTSEGYQPFYGENGANQLVCAPSSDMGEDSSGAPIGRDNSIRTTALNNGFRKNFTGTSASAPMVSGVVALMLEANPALTWRDVRLILARTARQNDPVDRWITYAGEPPVLFQPNWTRNFGLNHSHRYGFGVVDAAAAVNAAVTWTSVGGSSTLRRCGPYTTTPSGPAALIPDYSGGYNPITSTVSLSGADCTIQQVEFVEVRVTAPAIDDRRPNPGSGDLRIRLISPSGLVSELADEHRCYDDREQVVSCGDYDDYAFGSVRHLDEPVVNAALALGQGDWTLEVADGRTGFTSRLDRWTLTFYGR